MQHRKSRLIKKIVNNHLSEIVIVVFQFFGIALFSYINVVLINDSIAAKSPYLKQIFISVDFALSLFVCISFGRQFSGGLYNPAITLFRMLRKNQRLPFRTGMLYMVTQFIGSLAGCCLAYWADNLKYSSINQILPTQLQLRKFVSQMLGTAALSIVIQISSEKKMTFIEHNRQFYICMPLFFMIARQFSSFSNGMNPALGFGYELGYCFFNGNWQVFAMSYILIVAPFIGAVIALIVFQNVLKPLYPLRVNQVKKEIQQIKKQRIQKEYSCSVITVRDLSFKGHKYSFGDIINIDPQNQMYVHSQDEAVMVQDIKSNNAVLSVDEIQQQIQPIMKTISFGFVRPKPVEKFNY